MPTKTFDTDDLHLAALLSLIVEPIMARAISSQRSVWTFPVRDDVMVLVGRYGTGEARVEPKTFARALHRLQKEAKIRHGRPA